MVNVQVLDNSTIHDILINLSKEEAIAFRHIIEQTLEDFSIGGERQYQPTPSVVNRANGQNTLFRPFTSNSCIGTKITVQPAPAQGSKEPLHGVLVLTDGKGNPTGILSSDEVTGYRTSMNAMVPFSWRKHVARIVVFGAGLQALWHTRLILTLRGSEVQTITYVNASKDRVDRLVATVSGENQARGWGSSCSFRFINPTTSDAQQELESCLNDADCIFCTTPSKTPLFPASYLTKTKTGRIQRPLISAIGSWQPDMIELDPSLVRDTVTARDGYNPVTGEARGVILVDDGEFGLEGCGELVQSRVATRDVVEIGEIIALRRGGAEPGHLAEVERYVSEGFVVYKSVGVSLTDLTVSDAILGLCKQRL